MRNLLQDADRDRLAAPLATLAGEVAVGGRAFRALSAGEGSAIFPALGNARAAELLLMPGLREAQGPLGDALLDFVMAMAETPSGRAVRGGIELVTDDPQRLELLTPFFRFLGDLRKGAVRQELRGRPDVALRHTGNLVEFRIGRHATTLDVEDNVADAAVTREGDAVVLSHVTRVRGKAGLFSPREVEAGRLEYRYVIRPSSPVLRLEVRFTAAHALSRLRVTTALDAVAEEGLGGGAARLLSAGAWRDLPAPGAAASETWAREMPVSHLALGAAGWPGDAPVGHLRPAEPARVASVVAHGREAGALHWLLLRHGPVDLAAGETLAIREDRLLGVGHVAAVAGMMAGGVPEGLDLDPRTAGGAALQAVATALLLDATGAWRERLSPARRAELAAFAGRQVARLLRADAPEDLAAAVIGADALRRAEDGQGPDDMLPRLAGRLREVLRAAPRRPELGLAARALGALALARASAWPDGAESATALASVLDGIGTSAPGTAPGLTLDGAPVDALAEAEGVALLARAAGAAVLAAGAGAAIEPPVVDRAREMHRVAIALLRPLARPRAGALELHGPQGLAPGLQAAATLAFLAPERLVLPPGRAPA